MKRRIYKYLLPFRGSIEVPEEAEFLSVGAQGENIFAWFMVDTETTKLEKVRF